VCAWFLGGVPKSVMAFGGNDYFKDREVFDDIMAILEYETAAGSVRAFSQVLGTTQGNGSYFERFMGTMATIDISEIAAWTRIVPASIRTTGTSWDELERRGFLNRIVYAPELDYETGKAIPSYTSRPTSNYALPGGMNKPPHQPHLENFFAAIRGEAALHCDARTTFLSEAPVYYIDSAARSRMSIDFTPEQLTP
jgi:hypothetical protein